MERIIAFSIVIGLACHGLLIASGKNMILEPLKKWLDSVFITTTFQRTEPLGAQIKKEKVSKIYYPILYCPRCMPSLWGSLVYFDWVLVHGGFDIVEYLLVLVCSVTVSTILAELYER